ncbi:MAG: hypothetical protein FWH46_03025 [Methanimicrococcus sp.]|nr:hypothetical protein [Methanimicrococcus sp.]
MALVKSTPTSAFFCMFATVLILFSLCQPIAAESLIPVMPSDTLDYYTGYGEPELSASIRGSNEFNKGESATVQVSLVNKGVLKGVYYKEYISTPALGVSDYYIQEVDVNNGTTTYNLTQAIAIEDYVGYISASTLSNAHLQLAAVEMRLEANRINAESLNIQFQCDSPFIEIETGKEYVFINSLNNGSSSTVSVPVRISPNAPAGEYLLNATIDYSYPSNVKMFKVANATDGFTTFLYSDSYIQEYQKRQIQIQIPFYVASGPVFEVTNVEGILDAGRTKTVSITYTNIGDEMAYNAESKIDMMYPLSSSSNKGLLGDVAPGQSVTINYPITSHSSAMPKIYGINSNVRYYDDNDKLQITPGLKINVELIERNTILTFKNILIGTFLLVFLSLGADYYKSRKKKKGKDS